MSEENYISLNTLCKCYSIEMSLLHDFENHGLIEVITVEESLCIHTEQIQDLEKMLHLHQELQINAAGIDTIFNLLQHINELKKQKQLLMNKLKVYEEI
jgi:hypothetical protein